ncbi:hypothetical protein BZG36_02654 [Bifiguratus adelaidae]|uniref:Ornithine cyclodeaminase n=1 Tax=Bifiguratus adelaidae TaxID=1938954 RepID=A0A261Y2S9_9FUNG|nr:hypothetical protein BZG36_02654 [Bifiguratus adelaidae]
MRAIGAADVDKLLEDADVEELLSNQAACFKALSSKSSLVQSPHRTKIETEQHTLLFMPSRLSGANAAIKVVGVPKSGSAGLPSTTAVFDERTGQVSAIINSAKLTALRTAAGSALATRLVSSVDAKHLMVFGTGAQGKAHIELILHVRPKIESLTLWNRTAPRGQELAQWAKRRYPNLQISVIVGDESLQAAVASADIICTCTNASSPLFDGQWLKEQVHLNSIGSYTPYMQEIDQKTVLSATKVIVDSRDACLLEAGEHIRSVQEGHRHPETDWVELGEILGEIENDKSEVLEKWNGKRSIFKSVGISAQDSAVANWIAEAAQLRGLGTMIENF